jgi:two-component system OmpR family response regulator
MYAMSHKILIVDDDPHIRQVLSFALAKAGMETSEAGDGEAALSAVSARKPDLVVLDINMPAMDGLEVCRRLRAAGDLPILFLSSRDDEVDRVVGLELGGDDYVVKPFSPARSGRAGERDPEAWRAGAGRGRLRQVRQPRPPPARS